MGSSVSVHPAVCIFPFSTVCLSWMRHCSSSSQEEKPYFLSQGQPKHVPSLHVLFTHTFQTMPGTLLCLTVISQGWAHSWGWAKRWLTRTLNHRVPSWASCQSQLKPQRKELSFWYTSCTIYSATDRADSRVPGSTASTLPACDSFQRTPRK